MLLYDPPETADVTASMQFSHSTILSWEEAPRSFSYFVCIRNHFRNQNARIAEL